MLVSTKSDRHIITLIGLMLASLGVLLLLPPIPQDQSYHQFADQRTLLGTPHFWNVVSNLPFVAIGAMGLWQFRRDPATIVLFLGILLTGFGSAYYHWNPNDRTLFWDRLPMALSFMAILAIAIEERLNAKLGAVLLWPLIAIGVLSSLAVALDGRSSPLRLGAIFSLPRIAAAVCPVSAEIQRHIILVCRCGALRAGQVA